MGAYQVEEPGDQRPRAAHGVAHVEARAVDRGDLFVLVDSAVQVIKRKTYNSFHD